MTLSGSSLPSHTVHTKMSERAFASFAAADQAHCQGSTPALSPSPPSAEAFAIEGASAALRSTTDSAS